MLELKTNYLNQANADKNTKDQYEDDCQVDCAISLCCPLSISINLLPTDCQWGRIAFLTEVHPPHHPKCRNKAILYFPPTKSLLAFEG